MRKNSVKKYIIPILLLVVLCSGLLIIKKTDKIDIDNKANINVDVFFEGDNTPICIKAETIEKINEDYFEISIDVAEKSVVVDDKEMSLAEFLDISEDEVETVIASSDFEKFIKDSSLGDVEYKDGVIEISNPYSTNVLIVETEKENAIEDENIVEKKELIDDIYYVKYNSAVNTKEAYEELVNNSQIISVTKDEIVSISDDIETQVSVISSAGEYAWGRKTTGCDTYTNYLNLKGVTNNVYVAVLDTGIYSAHEVFKGVNKSDRIDFTYSENLLYDTPTKDVVDDNGHGTNVAGLVAECTPNNVKIVPLKIMNAEGKGVLSDVYQGISDTYQHVDVINVSLGSKVENMQTSSRREFNSFLRRVKEYGTIVCCAAGNDGINSVEFPAFSEHAFGVSAVDDSKKISSFSNYGTTIDYAMPGEELVLPDIGSESTYCIASGTSFSSPMLAAAAALVKCEKPNASFSEVQEIFNANIEDLGTSGKDIYYGYGMVNFNVNKFAKPVIVSAQATNTSWKRYNSINFKAVSSSNITNYAVTSSNVSPASSQWKSSGGSTTLIATIDTDYSGKNYLWVKDYNGNVTCEEINVGYIDNENPTVTSQISLVSITNNSAKMSIGVKDVKSGIARVVWHVDKANGGQVAVITTEVNPVGTTSEVTVEQNFTGLAPNTDYYVYAFVYDTLDNQTVANSCAITTNSDNINVFMVNKSNIVETIDFNADPSTVIATKRAEFDEDIENIKNTYLTSYKENVLFEDYDDLFVTRENNYSYPKLKSYTLKENYSTDTNGKQVKYYTLDYDVCSLKKTYDFSDLKDVVMDYGQTNKYLTNLKLDKDMFVIASSNRDIVQVSIENNNVYLNTAEYAGETQVTFTLPDSSMYVGSTKTIKVKVNPIKINAVSATVESKYIDNNTNASVTNVVFNGLLSGDSLVLGRDYSVLAYFDNANAGLNKKVYINVVLNSTNLAKKYVLENTDIVGSASIYDNTISVLKGDLDRNGVVDANDASVALEIYKAENATLEDILIGDMDDNDLIDSNDASLILELYKTNL